MCQIQCFLGKQSFAWSTIFLMIWTSSLGGEVLLANYSFHGIMYYAFINQIERKILKFGRYLNNINFKGRLSIWKQRELIQEMHWPIILKLVVLIAQVNRTLSVAELKNDHFEWKDVEYVVLKRQEFEEESGVLGAFLKLGYRTGNINTHFFQNVAHKYEISA